MSGPGLTSTWSYRSLPQASGGSVPELPLLNLVELGETRKVQDWLERHPGLLRADEVDQPLACAIRNNRHDLSGALLLRKIEVGPHSWRAAVEKGDLHLFKHLCEKASRVSRFALGYLANLAAGMGHWEILEEAYKRGWSLAQREFDDAGQLCSALSMAWKAGRTDFVLKVLEECPDILIRDHIRVEHDGTVLEACEQRDWAKARRLILTGADFNLCRQTQVGAGSALDVCSRIGSEALNTVNLLLARGADATTLRLDRDTPIGRAWRAGHFDIVRAIGKRTGLPFDILYRLAEQALHPATQPYEEGLAFLVEMGMDLQWAPEGKPPLLHQMCARHKRRGVELLLKHGANPNQDSAFGTPLELAFREPLSQWQGFGYPREEDVSDLLLDHGAKVPASMGLGDTPLELAEKYPCYKPALERLRALQEPLEIQEAETVDPGLQGGGEWVVDYKPTSLSDLEAQGFAEDPWT